MSKLSCKKLKEWIDDEQKSTYEYEETALDFVKAGDGSGVVEMFLGMSKDEHRHGKNLKKLYAKIC